MGKLHQLSKEYTPVHRRYSFLDKFNVGYINKLIPDSLSTMKEKIFRLLETLDRLEMDSESYGMIHFDYNDGNFNINFNTGQITVFDFDNSCFGWYMFDLASLWTHGVGWIQFEKDADKRRKFMDDYFSVVITGYRSETEISDIMLDKLSLFIQAGLMETIVDTFEVARNNDEEPECDEWLSYRVKCLENDIPYIGFFHEIYSYEEPFECEVRHI